MPVVSNRNSTVGMAKGYANDPIRKFAAAYQECVNDILHEAGVDIFTEPQKAVMIGASNEALKNFFVEGQEALTAAEAQAMNEADASALIDDARMMAEAQFDNDASALLEYTNIGAYNPVIGMTFPIHKNILMNNIFDKGAIPKVVAKEPKFTISMETRILTTPNGDEIDMFKEQYKMKDAIDSTAPFTEVTMTLPEVETTNVVTSIGGTGDENISIESYISAVKMEIYLAAGDINPETGVEVTSATEGKTTVWVPTHLEFSANYGEYDRTIMAPVKVTARDTNLTDIKVYSDVISGYMRNNKLALSSMKGVVTAVKFNARFDTSTAMFKTCSVSWKVRTDMVEIPSANPINVPVSPEEVKDVGALYNINQLSKILSLIRLALGNYKDDKIKEKLDQSFMLMPNTNKFATTFDFAPRSNYALDHVEWRYKTFMDYFDSVVTGLMQVLNDPNMTISIFGAPDLIRKITPTEYNYQTPSNIGPVDLDFVKTITTSDKRVYQFISSDKLRGNSNLIIILCPRNSERIIYRIYDYQMYVSNEIRNMMNPALPAIHAFERWKFVEYQPVQGRIKILNPTGLTNIAPNTDPIGTQSYSDFDLLK